MTRSSMWREFETGSAPLMRLLRVSVVLACIALLLYCGSLELTWPQQAVLGVVTVLIGVWMDRSSSSYLITLTLMMASCFSTFRYAYWRIATVVNFFRDPANTQSRRRTPSRFCICAILKRYGRCAVHRYRCRTTLPNGLPSTF